MWGNRHFEKLAVSDKHLLWWNFQESPRLMPVV